MNSTPEMEKLKNENVRLNREMEAIKQFFGYDSGSALSQMEEHKIKCEAEDNVERSKDTAYDELCKKADHLSDLGVKLGKCAYDPINSVRGWNRIGIRAHVKLSHRIII